MWFVMMDFTKLLADIGGFSGWSFATWILPFRPLPPRILPKNHLTCANFQIAVWHGWKCFCPKFYYEIKFYYEKVDRERAKGIPETFWDQCQLTRNLFLSFTIVKKTTGPDTRWKTIQWSYLEIFSVEVSLYHSYWYRYFCYSGSITFVQFLAVDFAAAPICVELFHFYWV